MHASQSDGITPSPEFDQVPHVTMPARIRSRFSWPLVAVLALQAAVSCSLIWSNTPYGDEALYLWAGRLELRHWFLGATMPPAAVTNYFSDFTRFFSGAPMIYPPLGAAASIIGGLAGARILSLVFMLIASVLLYRSTLMLYGQTAALVATVLWSLSESALKLGAFATFDPLANLLLCIAAYALVKSVASRRRAGLIALAAVALALGVITAYSYVTYLPLVVCLAAAMWGQKVGWRFAIGAASSLAGATAVLLLGLATALHLWPGISYVLSYRGARSAGYALLLRNVWGWEFLIAVPALAACLLACRKGRREELPLLVILAVAVVIVPVAQARIRTIAGIDKHIAFGLWLGAIAAGMAIAEMFPRIRSHAIAYSALAIIPLVSGWGQAWEALHIWPSASGVVSSLQNIAGKTSGNFMVAANEVGPAGGDRQILEFYIKQGNQWDRWYTPDLDPVFTARSDWEKYYAAELNGEHIRVVVLFYEGANSPTIHGSPAVRKAELLKLSSIRSAGLHFLIEAIESDRLLRVHAIGPYTVSGERGFWAIWSAR